MAGLIWRWEPAVVPGGISPGSKRVDAVNGQSMLSASAAPENGATFISLRRTASRAAPSSYPSAGAEASRQEGTQGMVPFPLPILSRAQSSLPTCLQLTSFPPMQSVTSKKVAML